MADEDPSDVAEVGVRARVGLTVSPLKRTRDEEEAHHEEGSDEQSWTTAELVKPNDGRKGESDVDDVLNGGSQERRGDVGGFHDVNDIVHHDAIE